MSPDQTRATLQACHAGMKGLDTSLQFIKAARDRRDAATHERESRWAWAQCGTVIPLLTAIAAEHDEMQPILERVQSIRDELIEIIRPD